MSYAADTHSYAAGTQVVLGTTVQVYVNDDGEFSAWPTGNNGKQVLSETRAGLIKEITKELRRATASVAVPFTELSVSRSVRTGRYQVRNGTAHGLHSRNHTTLVRWDDGQADQTHAWGENIYTRALTEAEGQEWVDLCHARDAAARRLSEWVEAHKITLHTVVSEALDSALGGDKEDA